MGTARLLSLDVFRGLAVIGMIFVNSVAVFHYGADVPAYGIFLHADWAGLTVADLVFPFFIFIVGVSLPFALGSVKAGRELSTAVIGKLLKRSVLLFLIGLGLTLSFADWDAPIRLLGVLQRIGLTFFCAALLYLTCGTRTLIAIIALVLLGYHGVQMLPIPDAAVDLHAPGQNFSSWFDRFALGSHVYARGAPVPFEPEGILGTLPSIAQALLGTLTGMLIRARGATGGTLRHMLLAGVVLTVLGFALAPFHPVVKATWSPTFVLVTSGLALLIFAALIWCLDVKGWRGPAATFAEAFGINAITAYVVHTYAMAPLLLNSVTASVQTSLSGLLPSALAMLLPVSLVVLISWLPVAVMKKKAIILKV